MTVFTLVWGSNFIFAELAVQEMTPLVFSAARFALGGATLVALYGISKWFNQRTKSTEANDIKWTMRDLAVVYVAAMLGAVMAPWMGIEGLAHTNGARAALWLAFAPLVSGILGRRFRTEKLGVAGMVGVALGLVGGVVLAIDGIQSKADFWIGDLLLFGSVLAAVAELHLLKPILSKRSPIRVMMQRTVFGGLIYLLIALPAGVALPWTQLPDIVWIALAFGGVLAIGIGHWVQGSAIRTIGPTRVVLYHNVVPVIALLASALLVLGRPSFVELVAIVLIVLGIGMVQLTDTRQSHHITEAERTVVLSTSQIMKPEIATRQAS